MKDKPEFDYNSGYYINSDIVFSNNNASVLSGRIQSGASTNRYFDYDSRPIKPLDANMLQKQLEQYNEMPEDELEKLRKK